MTTRTIVLLRHAKAETPTGVSDIDRPLAKRGVSDAVVAGKWLARKKLVPDLVLCSPARRTRETWQAVASVLMDAGSTTPAVRYDRTLYADGVSPLLELVRAVEDPVRTVLVIGHNPTISDASAYLQPDDSVDGFTGLRTCGLAVHRCTAAWSAVGPDTTELVDHHTARAHR
jgi:phosphohistidine phosphatase